jgi:hypothetical protein
MWKLAFIVGALVVSASPVDARDGSRGRELARDLERISRDVYRDKRPGPSSLREPASSRESALSRESLAAGRAAKKR